MIVRRRLWPRTSAACMFTSLQRPHSVSISRAPTVPRGRRLARARDSAGTGAGAEAGVGDDLPAEDAEAVEGRRCPNARCACAASGGQGQGQSPRSRRSDVDVEGEVHVDAVSMDADEPPPPPRVSLALPPSPRPLRFCSLLAPQLSGAPSPRTEFARLSLMSPYPGAAGPRSAWFSVGVGGAWMCRLRRSEGERREKAGAVDGVPSPVDAVAGASPSAEADTRCGAVPHVRFIEPVADASPRDADVQSSADVDVDVDVEEHELAEDPLLLSVSEE
ncbi:hypothetical protein B0H14DRAFT_1201415 [Mycena olivaceomarginata]|nr:hypothetical protein B0H14DRAFT_1201415 [Mycena olivaceomarginata]